MGYKKALQFLGRDGTEVETEPEEIRVEGKHAERVAPSNMLDNTAPVPEAETNEQELETPQLMEESTEKPLAKERVTKPGEQHMEIGKRQAAHDRIGKINAQAEVEELAKAEALEDTAGSEGGAEGKLRESAGDEVTPDFAAFLGSKAADKLEPERETLAAATILPLSLISTKKEWVWIFVLVCLAIAGYFLLRWYYGRNEATSLPKEVVKTSSDDPIRDFLDNY